MSIPTAREVKVLGDGHCLYRAVGKVVGMPPGDLIQIVTIMAENTAAGKQCQYTRLVKPEH